jgi:hypothetical protein
MVTSTISDADSLLSQFVGKLPYRVKTTSTIAKAMVNDAIALNNYNNGQLGQFCRPIVVGASVAIFVVVPTASEKSWRDQPRFCALAGKILFL